MFWTAPTIERYCDGSDNTSVPHATEFDVGHRKCVDSLIESRKLLCWLVEVSSGYIFLN